MQRREFLRQLASGLFVATAGPIVVPTKKVFRMGVALPTQNFFPFGTNFFIAINGIITMISHDGVLRDYSCNESGELVEIKPFKPRQSQSIPLPP